MTELRAVLWDVDGTLADSELVHKASMMLVMRQYGIQTTPEDELLGVDRAGVYANLYNKYEGVPDFNEYNARLDYQFLQNLADVRPIGAATDACYEFNQAGIMQLAVSNSNELLVEAILRAIGVRDLLVGIITADGKGRPKPSPDPYRRGLAVLDADAAHTIAIEDSSVGVTSARAAGLFVIGIPENGGEIGAHVHFKHMPDVSTPAMRDKLRNDYG